MIKVRAEGLLSGNNRPGLTVVEEVFCGYLRFPLV
jgi:hypothetical protein